MSDPKVKFKRSSVPGKIPNETQVPLGEIAINTYDGKVFASRNVGIGTTVFVVNPWTVGTGTDAYDTYFTAGNVGIGTTNPTETLSVLGKIQIGQNNTSDNRLIFRGQPSSSYRWNIDNYGSSNEFRIFREDDATTANGAVRLSISTTGTVTANAFVGDGSGLTGIVATGSGVIILDDMSSVGTASTINFGANLKASSVSSGITTITFTDNVSISGILTANQVYTSNNGNGQNVRIGDDAWIGDINIANTIRLSGAQDSTQAFIVFGDSNAVALGRTGTGPLYYGGDFTVAGSVTASSFNGNASSATYATSAGIATYATTAGIATVAQGLTGNPDISVGILTATSGNFSGIVTSSGANIFGSVGIGTNNPQYDLDVVGDINFTGTFNQNGSQFVASRWTSGTGDNIYRLNGNVGIGTTNPTSKLFVDGDARITGILTIGTSSIVLDGTDNRIDVGAGVTIHHIDGVQVGENTIHSSGHIANNLKVSGISTLGVTSTTDLTAQQLNVSGVSTFTGNVSFGSSAFFGDNDSLYFGDSNDLRIAHDGSNSFIQDVGTGILYIQSNGTGIDIQKVGGENLARFLTDGAVELYYDNVKEFETTGYGATVFGVLQTQGLLSSGISTISVNSASDALRITQTGAGNALVVEDSTNPDSTPFVVGTAGSVGIGTTNPVTPLHISDGNGAISAALYTSDYLTISAQNTAPGFNIIAASSVDSQRGVFKATRARGTLSSPTVPLTNDNTFSLLGAIYDGSTSRATAAINMDVDGTVGVGTAPQRITFWTGTGSSRLERARITSSGNLGIGHTNPTSKLDVVGDGNFTGVVTASSFSGNASSATYATTAGVATALQNARTFEITGDIIASPISFNGTGNVSLAATIQPNSVSLGTDTTGDYVQTITGTANQITVTSGTGEGSTPTLSVPNQFTAPQDVTVTRDLQVNRNLNVNGNITIGGSSATLFATEFKIYDPDLVLGFRTDALGNDISTDNTANHGGIAIASTEGTPLINLYDVGVGETNPSTYKKFMWFKSGTFAGLGTDAWISNYAIGIGSTQVPNGVRLAAGGMQVTDSTIRSPQLNITGVSTFSNNINITSGIITTTSAGGVGIGSYLRLKPYLNEGGEMVFDYINGTAGYYIDVDGSNVLRFGNYDTTGQFRFVTNSIERVRINNNGNVLIGSASSTGTASQLLQVTGGAYVSGNLGVGNTNPSYNIHVIATTDPAGMFFDAYGNVAANIAGRRANGTLASPTGVTTNNNLLVLQGGGYTTGSAFADAKAAIFMQASEVWTSTAQGSHIDFATTGPGTTTRSNKLRIDGYGNILVGTSSSTGTASQPLQVSGGGYVSGNFGIAHTNPTSRLDVVGDAQVSGVVTATTFIGQINAGVSTISVNSASNALRITQTGAGNALVVEDETNPDATPFVVNASGSVGLGTNSPQDALDIRNGDIRIQSDIPEIKFRSLNGTNQYYIGANISDSVDGGIIIGEGAGVTGGTDRLVISGTGNIGIGTANPTVNLQLSPTASISNVGTGITLAGTVGAALTVAQFLYSNTNTSYLRIKATRNQTGSNWLTASTKLVNVTDVTEQGYIEFNPNGTNYGLAFGGGPTSTEWARFSATGNLGIGHTNPTSTLHVVGNALISGVTTVTTLGVSVGSTASPAIQFGSALNGIHVGVTNTIDIVTNGSTSFRVDPDQALVAAGTTAIPGLSFITDVDTGFTNSDANQIEIVCGGTEEVAFNQTSSTFSNRIISVLANSATTGEGQIYLNGATGNRIDFNTNGVAAPAFTTRSAGTKLVLYPNVSASLSDFALGIENGTLWYSIDQAVFNKQHRWYAGTTQLADLKGTGELVIGSTSLTGTASQKLQVSGGAYFSNNVGIGITNPSSALSILGSILLNSTAAERQLRFDNGTTNIYLYGQTVGAGGNVGMYDGTNTRGVFTYRPSVNTLELTPTVLVATGTSTGTASQNLQVTGNAYISGNLGIGNTNPSTKLDVAGDIRLSAGDPEIEFNAGGPRLKVPAANTLTIHTGGGLNTTTNEVVRINNTGVGIGSTNPQESLDVVGGNGFVRIGQVFTGYNGITLNNSTTDANYNILSSPQDTSLYINRPTGGAMYFRMNNIDQMLLNSSGNLLVGTNTLTGTASQLLQVNSGAYVSGNLGVGHTNPTSKLDIVGDVKVSGVVTATTFTSTSDLNLKTNIQTIDNSLDTVLKLRGVTFDWKNDGKPSVGVVAQEVEEILPELVTDSNPKTVNYNGLVGVLIEAIKEQQTQINALKEEIELLKK